MDTNTANVIMFVVGAIVVIAYFMAMSGSFPWQKRK